MRFVPRERLGQGQLRDSVRPRFASDLRVRALAEALEATHPGVDLDRLRFTDLHRWIAELPGFSGDPKASNEKLLEAIYLAWRDERE